MKKGPSKYVWDLGMRESRLDTFANILVGEKRTQQVFVGLEDAAKKSADVCRAYVWVKRGPIKHV